MSLELTERPHIEAYLGRPENIQILEAIRDQVHQQYRQLEKEIPADIRLPTKPKIDPNLDKTIKDMFSTVESVLSIDPTTVSPVTYHVQKFKKRSLRLLLRPTVLGSLVGGAIGSQLVAVTGFSIGFPLGVCIVLLIVFEEYKRDSKALNRSNYNYKNRHIKIVKRGLINTKLTASHEQAHHLQNHFVKLLDFMGNGNPVVEGHAMLTEGLVSEVLDKESEYPLHQFVSLERLIPYLEWAYLYTLEANNRTPKPSKLPISEKSLTDVGQFREQHYGLGVAAMRVAAAKEDPLTIAKKVLNNDFEFLR